MISSELDNLVKIGKLKREPPSDEEIEGLQRSAEERLNDAGRTELSYSSRFDLAYNAAHALALVALRRAEHERGHAWILCLRRRGRQYDRLWDGEASGTSLDRYRQTLNALVRAALT